MKSVIFPFVFLCCLLTGLTLFPELHRSIDTVSMMLPALGICCLVGTFWMRSFLARGFVATFALLALGSTLASFPADTGSGNFRVYSKNVRYDNAFANELFADISKADVDAVMLQEVSRTNRALLGMLKDEFPFQHLCPGYSSIALLSKYPFVEAPLCSKTRAFLLAPIEVATHRLWLGSIYLHWSWLANSKDAEMETWSALAKLDGRVVLAGDFNSLPWSTRMKRFETLTGSSIIGPMHFTLKHRKLPVPLPIDHVLSPFGGSLTLRPLIGSDHHGVLGNLKLTP